MDALPPPRADATTNTGRPQPSLASIITPNSAGATFTTIEVTNRNTPHNRSKIAASEIDPQNREVEYRRASG